MAEEGQVLGCHSVESWIDAVPAWNRCPNAVFLRMDCLRCGLCRVISPFLAELAKSMPNVVFLRVDVDELETVAKEWEVEAMPTFLFLKIRNVVDKVVGAKREELVQKTEKHATA
uniref:Thioredoxin h n=1 Tax=Vitis vinifera TaxID=29760 RepID=E0AD93_VITVI|nr:thioredoxin h [Vitis vinifera]